MAKTKTITVGELRNDLERLLSYPDDTEVYFGTGNLTYTRLKNMGYRDEPRTVPSTVNVRFLEDYEITDDPASET